MSLSTSAKQAIAVALGSQPLGAELADAIDNGTQRKMNFDTATELTIVSGVITVTASNHTIDTEGDAATDDLNTIAGGDDGYILFVRAANTARTVVIKHAIGANNIACPNGRDINLAETTDGVMLVHDGTQWRAWVSALAPDETTVMIASGTIANAAVRTLNATPVSVITAPGTGKYIRVLSCYWRLNYTAPAFDAAAAGDTLVLRSENTSGPILVDDVAGNTIGAASANYEVIVGAAAEQVVATNKAIVAHITTGEWYASAGASSLTYKVYYQILNAP